MDSFWHDVLEDERELCAYTLAWLARTSHLNDFSHLDIFLPSDNKNVGRTCFHSRVLVFTGGGVRVYGVCLVPGPFQGGGYVLSQVPSGSAYALSQVPLGDPSCQVHPPWEGTLPWNTHQEGTPPRRYNPVLTSSGGH